MRHNGVPALMLAACVLLASGCGYYERRSNFKAAAQLTGGNPYAGRDAIRKHGCPACHTIPGVDGAHALVGPPLNRIASRIYIAGQLPNTPENLIHWIRNPHQVEQHTAMPDMGINEQDGRDIAAYLYTLR